MRYIAILFILMLTMSAHAQEEEVPSWCVSLWYPSSEFSSSEDILANADIINEVNAFWYTPAPDGSLIVLPEAENVDDLTAWREAGLTIIPSIFGSVGDVIADDLREVHIAAITETVVRMDYDGIDIDYEGFAASTRDDFSLFVEGLRDALHAEGRTLSVTVHAKVDEGMWEGALAQDWHRIIPAADIFRIMTYDYTSRNEPPGPISPPAWVLEVLAYAKSVTEATGEDMSKIQMGLHFYGYSWQRGNPPATTTAYASIQNYLTSFNLEVFRNPDDMEAYVDFKITGLPRQVVYFADPIGLAYKLDLVVEQFPDIGGVSIWGIGGEHPDLWATLREYTAGCV
ncbi:MAG: glycosyl hydrolase family 18 protein [bacterium]|nr:glycosyl hydrolase family 18 protein [bacterium]